MASTTPHGAARQITSRLSCSEATAIPQARSPADRAVSKPANRPVAAPVAALVIAQPNDSD
jgi:hypothetical protein